MWRQQESYLQWLLVSTWAVMARIGGEDIEDLTLKPYEAVTAIGAGKI